MQVDLHYHAHAFTSMDDALDPEMNADYAARLLLTLYGGETGGSCDVAVGLYHSHSALLAAEYRDRVAMLGSDILHGTLRGVPLYVRAIRQGTLRLPLDDVDQRQQATNEAPAALIHQGCQSPWFSRIRLCRAEGCVDRSPRSLRQQ
jgi:hypothetical protein